MSQANVDLMRELYSAFGRGDIPTALAGLDAEVDWHSAEGFPDGGHFVGPNAVLQGVLMKLGTDWDGFTIDLEELIDAGDKVIGIGWYGGTYKATGKSMRARFAHVWTLRDGKVVHYQQIADTAKVREAVEG